MLLTSNSEQLNHMIQIQISIILFIYFLLVFILEIEGKRACIQVGGGRRERSQAELPNEHGDSPQNPDHNFS